MIRIRAFRKREGARERAIATLVGEELVAVLLPLRVPLPTDRQPVAGKRDLEILLVDSGQIRLEDVCVLRLLRLEPGREDRISRAAEHRRHLGERIPVQKIAHRAEGIPDGRSLGLRFVPADDICHFVIPPVHSLDLPATPGKRMANAPRRGGRAAPCSLASRSKHLFRKHGGGRVKSGRICEWSYRCPEITRSGPERRTRSAQRSTDWA